jgi:hypothetical protein
MSAWSMILIGPLSKFERPVYMTRLPRDIDLPRIEQFPELLTIISMPTGAVHPAYLVTPRICRVNYFAKTDGCRSNTDVH